MLTFGKRFILICELQLSFHFVWEMLFFFMLSGNLIYVPGVISKEVTPGGKLPFPGCGISIVPFAAGSPVGERFFRISAI